MDALWYIVYVAAYLLSGVLAYLGCKVHYALVYGDTPWIPPQPVCWVCIGCLGPLGFIAAWLSVVFAVWDECRPPG